jgi:hypothetical protein
MTSNKYRFLFGKQHQKQKIKKGRIISIKKLKGDRETTKGERREETQGMAKKEKEREKSFISI